MSLITLLSSSPLLHLLLLMGFSEGRSLTGDLHHHHKVSPESLLISHLSDSSNEVIPKNGATRESFPQVEKKRRPVLPSYLDLVDTQLNKEEEPSGPLIRAWFPTSLTRALSSSAGERDGIGSTLLFFQQNQRPQLIRHFVKAEFILSTKPEAALTLTGNDILVRLQVGELTYLSHLFSNSSHLANYLTFNLSSFLAAFMETQKEDSPFQLTFNVTLSSNSSARSLYLDEVFDTREEQPGILLYYKISQRTPSLSSLGRRSRSRRSIDSSSSPPPPTLAINNTSCTPNCSTSDEDIPDRRNITVDESPSNSTLHLCRRVEWSVSVEDIDWVEVVSHRKLELGYCTGECPFPLENELYNFTLHSYFLDKFKRNKHSQIPSNFPRRSCCIPVTYHPIRVWVEEEPSVFGFIQYDNVTVDACGCR